MTNPFLGSGFTTSCLFATATLRRIPHVRQTMLTIAREVATQYEQLTLESSTAVKLDSKLLEPSGANMAAKKLLS